MKLCLTIGGILSIFLIISESKAAITQQAFVMFPSASIAPSPNGRYILRNEDLNNENQDHILYLKDTKTGREEKLYSYGRSVEVLWSQDSNALILNDHALSDFANAFLFFFGREKKVIDLYKELENNLRSNESIFKNDHMYIYATKWLSADKVSVQITGHGDINPGGFTEFYEYTVDKGFKFVKKLDNEKHEME